MASLRIGEVAKRSGLGIETIRFYERKGLLDEPARRASGYRQYDERALAQLSFIVRAKGLGFTLSEIKELLGLWFDPATTCTDVRRRARQKIDDIRVRIQSLEAMQRSLVGLIEQCESRSRLGDCPLLVGLSPPDEARPQKSIQR
ncbi:MAG: heavy metal-responsive transcriptional regulator [Planctomycetaceae bacterium]